MPPFGFIVLPRLPSSTLAAGHGQSIIFNYTPSEWQKASAINNACPQLTPNAPPLLQPKAKQPFPGKRIFSGLQDGNLLAASQQTAMSWENIQQKQAKAIKTQKAQFLLEQYKDIHYTY